MATSKIGITPPTKKEIDLVRQELCDKLEKAENQPVSEKRNATVVFSEQRDDLEELLSARV